MVPVMEPSTTRTIEFVVPAVRGRSWENIRLRPREESCNVSIADAGLFLGSLCWCGTPRVKKIRALADSAYASPNHFPADHDYDSLPARARPVNKAPTMSPGPHSTTSEHFHYTFVSAHCHAIAYHGPVGVTQCNDCEIWLVGRLKGAQGRLIPARKPSSNRRICDLQKSRQDCGNSRQHNLPVRQRGRHLPILRFKQGMAENVAEVLARSGGQTLRDLGMLYIADNDSE